MDNIETINNENENLSPLKAYFPDVNFLAMTGTATVIMIDAIKKS